MVEGGLASTTKDVLGADGRISSGLDSFVDRIEVRVDGVRRLVRSVEQHVRGRVLCEFYLALFVHVDGRKDQCVR